MAVAAAVSIIAALSSNIIAISIYHNAAMSSPLMLASLLVFLYALFNLTLATLVAVDKVKEGTIRILVCVYTVDSKPVPGLCGVGVFGATLGMGVGLIIPSVMACTGYPVT